MILHTCNSKGWEKLIYVLICIRDLSIPHGVVGKTKLVHSVLFGEADDLKIRNQCQSEGKIRVRPNSVHKLWFSAVLYSIICVYQILLEGENLYKVNNLTFILPVINNNQI